MSADGAPIGPEVAAAGTGNGVMHVALMALDRALSTLLVSSRNNRSFWIGEFPFTSSDRL